MAVAAPVALTRASTVAKSGDYNDDLAVKVVLKQLPLDEDYAALIKSETLTRLNDNKKVEITKSRL